MVAWLARCQAAAPLAAFCVVGLSFALGGVPYSQLVLGIGLLSYAAVVRVTPWLRGTATWARWGSFGGDVRLLAVASGLVAAVALFSWYLLLRPNLDDLVDAFVPDEPLGILIRRRAGGMFAPWIAHVFTDVVIAGIVIVLVRPNMAPHAAAAVLSVCGLG